MENQPLISVIVPCYNYAAFLEECVKSLSDQTCASWECIIVDDGSSDNTPGVAKRLMEKDKRVHYIHQENAGPAVARNNGIRKAKGEFIQFLDADDLLEHKKFEQQVKFLNDHPSCDLVYSGVKYFRSGNPDVLFHNMSLEGSKPWMKNISGKGKEMITALLNGNIMVISSPLFRRTLLEKYGSMDEQLFYNEDWELWTRYAMANASFCFDAPEGSQALVRVHESYSKDNFKMYAYGLLACLKMKKNIRERVYTKIMEPKINYHMRIIDEKLMEILRSDEGEAVRRAEFIYELTGLKRYAGYVFMFIRYPAWYCAAWSKLLFVSNKIKNGILYA